MGGMKDTLGDTPYPDLFTLPKPPAATAFDGKTYDPAQDHGRLKGQLAKVFSFMRDGQWRTLADIAESAGGTEAAVSARLRDLRKAKYGSHQVERNHIGSGLYRYRLIVNTRQGSRT